MTYMGQYNSNTTYSLNDVVTYNGVSYVSIQPDNSGENPAVDNAWWDVLDDLSTITAGTVSADLANVVNVRTYGAACNWNGSSGTDDTSAFQSAVTAAHSLYMTNNSPVTVKVSGSCIVNGTVYIGSGVILSGPGEIVVQTQTGGTLFWLNADFGGCQDLTLTFTAAAIGNDANVAAISWRNSSNDTTAHKHWHVRNTTIYGNASWGILVDAYQGGINSSISDVDISGNSVVSPVIATNSDGIHVAGAAFNVTIRGNRVTNRNDAAIAVTSSAGSVAPQNVIVDDNILTDNKVGLDCSGCQNTIWANNHVTASNTFQGDSDPAARAITFGGIPPLNVKFIGNYLFNTSTGEVAAKVDQRPFTGPTNVEWLDNTIGPRGLLMYANTASISNNTFQSGSSLGVYADPSINAQNITIGQNFWQGSGTFIANSNPGFYTGNYMTNQVAPGGLTKNVSSNGNFVDPAAMSPISPTPTVNKVACIRVVGPPVLIGVCSNAPDAAGGCACI